MIRLCVHSDRHHQGPTADGVFLPDDPAKLLAAGKLNPGASVLWGMNSNDSTFAFEMSSYVSETEFVAQLTTC